MNRSRLTAMLLTLSLPLFLLTGCYDSREIDETGYVIALGIDRAETEGIYRYTFQFSNPLAIGGGDESGSGGTAEPEEKGGVWDSGNPTVKNVTVDAPDYHIAGSMLHNFMSKHPNLAHIKLIVFSAALAEEGVFEHAQLLLQEREVRPNTNIAVARGSAEEFLKGVNPKLEVNTAKYYELLTKDESLVYAPMVQLREFVDAMCGDARAPVLPLADISHSKEQIDTAQEEKYQTSDTGWKRVGFLAGELPRNSDVKSEFMGMGIFRDKKLIAQVDGSEVLLYRLLCGEINHAFLTASDLHNKEEELTFQIWMNTKPHYSVKMQDGKPSVRISLEVNANFVGAQVTDAYRNYDELESYAQEILRTELLRFLQKTAQEYRADILGIGTRVKMQCLTWQEWQAVGWEECYPRSEFFIDLRLKIRRSGTTVPLTIE